MRFLGLLMALAGAAPTPEADTMHWLCYYSDAAPVEAFDPFDLLVLDSDYHPELGPLAERGKTLVGYLSVGEVENTRSHFDAVREEGILLAENPNWKGSFMVDVRDPRWIRRIVEQLVPRILGRGFNGIFLDTVDNASYLESLDPERYRGMTDAMAALVRTVRRHFPHIPIIMNRGLDILPRVETEIDMVLGESIYADYDFESGSYRRVAADEYRSQVTRLQDARRRRPELMVLTLDYWNPEDLEGMARIYRAQRANGFVPYVATVKLDRIIAEPGF